MQLTGITPYARYEHIESGRQVNIHRGKQKGRCNTVLFYYRSGKRIYVSNWELEKEWKKVDFKV